MQKVREYMRGMMNVGQDEGLFVEEDEFVSKQREAINLIRASNIEDLPQEVLELISDSNGTNPSLELNYSKDRSFLTILETEKSKKLSVFLKKNIKHFYFIDIDNGKFIDIISWWKNSLGFTSLDKYAVKGSLASGFAAFTKDGLIISISQFKNKLLNRLLMKVLSKENAAHAFGPAVALHEMGHTFQINHDLETSKSLLSRTIESNVKSFLLAFLVSLAPILKNGENLSNTRNESSLLERNATAFSFSVMRKLRDEGIDILRGYENKDVISALELALSSYEKGFVGIPGRKFRTKKINKSFKIKRTIKPIETISP